jgi:hypothetical protein
MTETPAALDSNAMGELALALVLEDLKAREARADLDEGQAREILSAALERFPAESHPELHALLDSEDAEK